MPFLAYVLAMIVAVGGLLFGVEVITTPPPQKSAVEAPVVPSKLAQREADRLEEKTEGDPSRPLTPIYPANPGGKTYVSAVYPTSNQSRAVANEAAVAERSAIHCEVAACASTYTSFRRSDCTYQPYEGPRRVCTAPPQQRSAQREHPLDILTSRATRLEPRTEPASFEPATTGYAYEIKNDQR